MNEVEYATMAQNNAGQIGGAAAQQLNVLKKASLHERLQQANKMASDAACNLSALINVVMQPQPLSGVGNQDPQTLKDSTVTGDMDDLIRTLGNIVNSVHRLSSAISG